MSENGSVTSLGFGKDIITKRVLFICAGNACRSQMAEAIFNRSAPPGWAAVSGGIKPASRVSHRAIKALSETGIEHVNATPRKLSNERIKEADILIGVCSVSEVCLAMPPEKKVDYWGIPDPYPGDDEAYLPRCRLVRDLIKKKVSRLLQELESEN